MEYEAIIGLEVHVELSTETKMYCGCTTKFGGRPNTHCCPVCLGLPGSLPQLNKKVLEYGIRAGLALNCDITKKTRMDRKNYFYPDCPKDYQITQDELPLCREGFIEIDKENGENKKIGIERIHIEEDAGKLIHTKVGTLVDFNRAGVPLIEIVSKPDMREASEAVAYLLKLKSILACVGVSDCKMEEGSLRCDTNISIREKGCETFGVRTEVKNINSFKAVEKTLLYEFDRQVKALENGEKLTQDTRRWDETKNETFPMRSKEFANDYRYFPEGDLVTINISDEYINGIKKTIPELPFEKAERFVKEYEIPEYDAGVLTLSMAMADFFEKAAIESKDPKAASNWLMGDISRLLNEKVLDIAEIKFTPGNLAELIILINSGKISNSIGKKVIQQMFTSGKNPQKIIEENGWIQNSDEDFILDIVKKTLDNNPASIEEFKKGRKRIAGFLIGLVMQETKGKANPKIVSKLVNEELAKR